MLYVNFIVLWIDVLVGRNSSACTALYYFVSSFCFVHFVRALLLIAVVSVVVLVLPNAICLY